MTEGVTIWLTGLSGAGKSTIAQVLERELRERVQRVELLDGDEVRAYLNKDLGFSKEDRDTNIQRIGWVCQLLTRNGVIVIVAAISPYRAVRDEVRERIGRFIEVYIECPVEILIERDVKGLYKKALAGEIANFTGISDPYEPPLNPDVICYSDGRETAEQSAARIIALLEQRSYIESRPAVTTATENDTGYTEDEEDEVIERLRSLGYL